MKKQYGKYYLGLDMGTDSVGWAVTDTENYQIQKFHGKPMWGVHLFDAGKTAEERRLFRTARRRNDRKKQRILLLQEIMAPHIYQVDPGFYMRLKDSFFVEEDKKEKQPNTLFNDSRFTDKDYHKAYPTIYHLRKAFVNGDRVSDIRLLYLAIAHLLKNRGHFLFDGQEIDPQGSFAPIFSDLCNALQEELEIPFSSARSEEVGNILKDKTKSISDKQKELFRMLSCGDSNKKAQETAILKLLTGGSTVLADLFKDDEYKDSELNKICFSDSAYEDKVNPLGDLLQDRMFIVEKLKASYDWALLADILHGEIFLCHAKVETFETHKRDLALLKKMTRKYLPEKFKEIFVESNRDCNYPAYIGMTKINGKKRTVEKKKCLQEDLNKYLEKLFAEAGDLPNDDLELALLRSQLANRVLLPKQVVKDNGVIPFQILQKELRAILENASEMFPFLKEKDADGFSPAEKIEKTFLFKIPYFVGPLNPAHANAGHCWIVRKEPGAIRPWNFENKVDLEKCEEAFILRMTNKCTYLIGEDVLPKESILYSKFMVLNELNNLKLDGQPLRPDLKQKMFREKFLKEKKITLEKIINFLISEGEIKRIKNKDGSTEIDTVISGIDGDFKSSMRSYIEITRILGEKKISEEKMDEIILKIALSGDPKRLPAKIRAIIGEGFSDKQINQLSALKYEDWGRFSRKFLNEIYHIDPATGECITIIAMLEQKSENLMQLLSSKYTFADKIAEFNAEFSSGSEKISYKDVENLYVSPAVRRSIWRALSIVKEIVGIMGHAPEKVFVEMARQEGEKGKRTVSRKKALLDLYKNCKEEELALFSALEGKSENELRGDRLYLYFTQMGKCMYSGERIDLSALLTDYQAYDIDHIYPQSLIMDDSLNNRVLVKREINAHKGKEFPLDSEIQTKNGAFWKYLESKGLISQEKFNRLTRKHPFSQDELEGFIARQLVETQQATKAAAEILKRVFSDSEIVYAKAGNVSKFRQDFGFIKVREINDFHHAKDAYLNIVVGNIYHTKFTSDPRNFFRAKEKQAYNLKRMFEFDVERNGVYAWKTGDAGSIGLVRKTMEGNDVRFTRYAVETKGGFYDQMLMKRGGGQFPIKSKDERLKNIDRYGGYNKVLGAYFFLVEHTEKNKRIRTIEHVPYLLAKRIQEQPEYLDIYCKEELQLKDHRILIRRILKNALFKIDGFPMHLSARTGDSLRCAGAVQLKVSLEDELYLKKINNYINRRKINREAIISEKDKISLEKNIDIYQKFKTKLSNDSIYGKFLSLQEKNLQDGQKKFESLTLESQCEVLSQILRFFRCSVELTDLSLIGKGKTLGAIQFSKKITGKKSVLLINQSVTGLFEEEIDLLKL